MTGTGTQTDPYIVSSWGDFKTAIATAGAYVVMDPDASAKVIDLNGSAANPVTQRLDFNCASLAGNGWRIRNLYYSSDMDHLLVSSGTCDHQIQDLHFDNLVCSNGSRSMMCMPRTTLTGCSFTGVKYFTSSAYLLVAGSTSYSMTCRSCTFAMQHLGTGTPSGFATRCDFIDCNFQFDASINTEGGRQNKLFAYSGLTDCLMRGSIALNPTGVNGLLYITDANKPMKNCFIAVDLTNASDYNIVLYPGNAAATTCVVSDLIDSSITCNVGTNVQYVTAAQGKSADYLNSIGFPVSEVV